MLRTTPSEPLLEGILRSGLIRPGDRVLVAVSGGPDSTALLVALSELGIDCVAAHFDHALQPASAGVASDVGALCERRGVQLLSERRVAPMARGSVQAAARELRYAFLDRARLAAAASTVVLAHTADDVVEGALMHLLRGCGIAGLRGMPARRGSYARPMLAVWRRDVAVFLERRGIVAFDDPANANLSFARARMRHQVLPAFERGRPGISRRIHSVALHASALQDAVERRAAAELSSNTPARTEVARLPEPVAVELMKLLYSGAGGARPGLSRAHLAAMLRLARSDRGGGSVDLPGGLRFRIVGHHMEVVARTVDRLTAGAGTATLEIKACAGCDAPDAVHLKSGLRLSLGYRRPGLRMRPAGGRGSRKLQDIMVDARVPRENRDGWPLVFAEERLAWVPRIAVDADLVSPSGAPAIHVEISPMPVRWQPKVGRLDAPISPRGESS